MEKIKKRIFNDVTNDLELTSELEFTIKKHIKNTINSVLLYCNRNDIPKELELIATEIVEDLINISSSSSSTTSETTNNDNSIASIKRGDTTITYNNSDSETTTTIEANISFVKDYESQLVYFKKMRLPS
ncbi:MAG: hypothetical protein R3Y29_06595 [bacterium]